jgi:hypothetical protein
VDCLARKRRQVFDAVVVEIVQPRPTTTGNNFVSLDVTVGVEVVLHNGKTLTAGNLNRLDDGLDIFVAASLPKNNAFTRIEHDVAQLEVGFGDAVDVALEILVGPRFESTRIEMGHANANDSELLDA